MFKNSFLKCMSVNKYSQTFKFNNLYKTITKTNFDQFKERPKRHFVLLYKYVEDMNYKRIPYREEHLKLIEQFEKNGAVIMGGAFFPNDGACLIFQANDETVPDSFVKKDPYYRNKLVTDYEIKEIELIQKKRFDEIALYYKYR